MAAGALLPMKMERAFRGAQARRPPRPSRRDFGGGVKIHCRSRAAWSSWSIFGHLWNTGAVGWKCAREPGSRPYKGTGRK